MVACKPASGKRTERLRSARPSTNPRSRLGRVVVFEIVGGTVEVVSAVRHKPEDDCHAASNDVRGAVQFLKVRGIGSGKVGVTGYCMGGALTVLALTVMPEVDAGVVWYGLPPLEYVDASKIGARPVQAHSALQDQAFSIDDVDALEARLLEAKVRYEGHRYLAQHGFANETAFGSRRLPITQYDPVWAQQAWDRTMRFFGQHLT